MNLRKRIVGIILASCFLFFQNSNDLFAARNVTCRAMDSSRKILGVYVHTEKGEPVCDCNNPDIPAKLKKSCADSKRAF